MKWAFISGDRLDLISHMMLGGRGGIEKIRWRREGGIYLRSARRGRASSPSSSSPSSRGGRTSRPAALPLPYRLISPIVCGAWDHTDWSRRISPPLHPKPPELTTSRLVSIKISLHDLHRCFSDVASLQLEKVKLVLLKIIFLSSLNARHFNFFTPDARLAPGTWVERSFNSKLSAFIFLNLKTNFFNKVRFEKSGETSRKNIFFLLWIQFYFFYLVKPHDFMQQMSNFIFFFFFLHHVRCRVAVASAKQMCSSHCDRWPIPIILIKKKKKQNSSFKMITSSILLKKITV